MVDEVSHTLIDIQKKISDLIATTHDLNEALVQTGEAHKNTASFREQPTEEVPMTEPVPPQPHMTVIDNLLNELGADISTARDRAYSIRNWVNPSE